MQKIIDLSHPISEDMPVYPGTDPPKINEICTIEKDGFRESLISLYSHTGTHIDVPFHLMPDGKKIDSFECTSFFGSAITIDCRNLVQIDLKLVQENYYNAEDPDFIIFYTGWDKWWGNKQYFEGFPVLSHDAAEFISSLSIKGLGIDAISYDPVGDANLLNHKILMKKDKILVENLCNLENLTYKYFTFSCLPLNIIGIDGSPTRAFAILT